MPNANRLLYKVASTSYGVAQESGGNRLVAKELKELMKEPMKEPAKESSQIKTMCHYIEYHALHTRKINSN